MNSRKESKMKLLDFEGQSVIDSRDVAEMTGKEHNHLMRDIRSYVNDFEDSPKLDPRQFFIPSTYTSKQGKVLPNYLLTKQGCEFVANKMTGAKGNQFTAEYVSLFNQMETHIKAEQPQYYIPQTYPEALRLAAKQAEQIAKDKPKVDYYDSQMKNPGLMAITDIAKNYGWSGQKMNQELKERGIIFREGKKRWCLYQKYADKGYAAIEPAPFGNNKYTSRTLKWTQKGRKFIYDLLAQDEIYPIIETMGKDNSDNLIDMPKR